MRSKAPTKFRTTAAIPTRSATTRISDILLRGVCCALLLAVSACGVLGEDDLNDDNKTIYVNIPDPAFLKACLAACDQNGDGRVSRYEAQLVRNLSCPDAGIQNVTGIEEFIYLVSFDCAGNEIVTLNMRYNRRLERLDCSRNRIGYLYVKGLLLLVELRCGENAIPAIDLSQSPVLSTLVCSGNALVTLDVNFCARQFNLLDALDNPELTTLYVSSSQNFLSLQLDGQTSVVYL